MKQSSSFTQVATNFLNLLQGYTKGIRFVAVLTMLLTIGVGSMWGATTTYTFTSEKWADSSNGWTSGKDGVAYLNSGVQVTKNGTGAYATSKISFTNISKIDVKYCTNASNGAGTIVLTVGSTSKTLTVSKTGGTTMRTISASFDPNVSGTVKITVNCTTNSIYVGGITITTEDATCTEPTITFSNGSYTVGGPVLDLSNLFDSNSNGAVTYSVTNANGTGATISGSNFTATATGSATVSATQAAAGSYCEGSATATINVNKQSATITLSEAGVETSVKGMSVGDSYTLPSTTSQSCGDLEFVGWSTEIIENSPTKPTAATYFEPDASVTLAADQTFYAVFAEGSGDGEEGWQKVTSTDQVKDGEIYAFISFDDAYYLANAQSTSNPPVKSVSKTNGILNVTNEMKWIASANSGGFEFKSYSKSDYYLWGGSANDAIRINTTSSKANATKVWYTKKLDTYGVVIYHNASTDGAKHLATNGSTDWRNYLDNNTLSNTNRVANLYKFTAGTTYSDYITQCTTKPSVTLNLNGGKFATEPNDWTKDGDNYTKEVDGSVTLPTPTQIGYDFKGWYDTASGGTKIADGGMDYTPSEDIELYAQWNPITYTVTLNPGSGSCDNNQISGTYSEGVKLPTASPSNACTEEGWTFVGWATASVDETTTAPTTFAANQTYNPTTNIELYAVYMKQTFTLSTVYHSTTYYVGGYESSKAILTAETEKNNAMVFRIVDGQYLHCEDGYISHSSTSSTNISCYLSKEGNVFPWTITDNTETISFQSTKAEGNVRYLGYNYNDGNPRFAVYVESYAHNFTKTTTTTYNSNPECTPPCAMVTVTNATPSIGGFSLSIDQEAVTSPIENCGQGDLIITIVPYAGYRIKDVSNTTDLSIDAFGTATVRYTKNTTIYSEVTLEPREYTITLHTNGGTINSGNVSSYKCGEGAILPTDVTKDGYTFGGWYDLETFYGSAVTTIGTTETDSKEFWAKWTPAVYSITYKDQGDGAFSGQHEAGYPENHTYNTATTLKSASKDHYTFSGWYKESDCSGDAVTTLGATEYTDNITLYAKWNANQYTVTFNTNGHGTAPTPQTVEYGSQATKPDNPTADGYSFVNWYKDADCTEAYNFNSTITGNITLYAKWSKIIVVAWKVNGQSKGSTTGVAGAHVTPPTVNPIPCGAVLAGWTDAENGVYVDGTSTLYAGEKPSIEVTENKTFYAVFADYDEQQ